MQNDFLKTAMAMKELEEALGSAEKLAEEKQEQLKLRQADADRRFEECEKKIARLQSTAGAATENIDKVINRLNDMLVENGSGNNNN